MGGTGTKAHDYKALVYCEEIHLKTNLLKQRNQEQSKEKRVNFTVFITSERTRIQSRCFL